MGDGTKGGYRSENKVGTGQGFQNTVQQNAQSLGGSLSLSNPEDPVVYLGHSLPNFRTYSEAVGYKGGKVDDLQTLSAVSNQYYNWDTKTRNKFLSQLGLAGYNVSSMTDAELQDRWRAYAAQSAAYYAAGKSLTPWDIMAIDRRTREDAGPTTTTQTNKSFNISSFEDAKGLFNEAAKSLIGRAATKSEISAFQSKLNAYEQAHPSVTTTTTTSRGGNTSSTSTTSGGVTQGAQVGIAEDRLKDDPEYGAYQASTTYMNALLQLIGG